MPGIRNSPLTYRQSFFCSAHLWHIVQPAAVPSALVVMLLGTRHEPALLAVKADGMKAA